MNQNIQQSERAPWNDFPKVIRNGDLRTLEVHEEYVAAKAGDWRQAFILIDKVMTSEFVESVREALGGRKPKLVPVLAVEATGSNKIPAMMAVHLSERLGLDVEESIIQSSKVFRTNSGSDHRLAYNPVFKGKVEKGQDYLIMDDTLAMGGTLSSLRGYIENRGGNVVLATVMTAHPGALDMVIKPAMLAGIERKHGTAMNELWLSEFGYPIDQLTQGEAGHLKAAASVEQIRERLHNAKYQANERYSSHRSFSPGNG